MTRFVRLCTLRLSSLLLFLAIVIFFCRHIAGILAGRQSLCAPENPVPCPYSALWEVYFAISPQQWTSALELCFSSFN